MRFINRPSRKILYTARSISHDKAHRLRLLEESLVAAVNGPKIEATLLEIKKNGLIAALRAQLDRG